MNGDKIKKLEKHGWKVGSAKDFLGLSIGEAAYVDVKVALEEKLWNKKKSSLLAPTLSKEGS